jgi:hypothetical protein
VRDRIRLLEWVSAGHVPVEALGPAQGPARSDVVTAEGVFLAPVTVVVQSYGLLTYPEP